MEKVFPASLPDPGSAGHNSYARTLPKFQNEANWDNSSNFSG